MLTFHVEAEGRFVGRRKLAEIVFTLGSLLLVDSELALVRGILKDLLRTVFYGYRLQGGQAVKFVLGAAFRGFLLELEGLGLLSVLGNGLEVALEDFFGVFTFQVLVEVAIHF